MGRRFDHQHAGEERAAGDVTRHPEFISPNIFVANDLALLYYLALGNSSGQITDSNQVDDGMWQDAVDEAMAQLS